MNSDLPIQLNPEHIQNAEKALVLRGQPSRYLRVFKKLLGPINPVLTSFLVELCEATNHNDSLVQDESYILIDKPVIKRHLKQQNNPSSNSTIDNRISDCLNMNLADRFIVEFISQTNRRAYPKQVILFRSPLEIEGILSELIQQTKETNSEIAKTSPIKLNEAIRRSIEADNLLLPAELLQELETTGSKTILLLKNWMTLGRGWRLTSSHKDPDEQTILHLGKNRYCPVKVIAPPEVSGTATQDDQKLLAILLNWCARSNNRQRMLGNPVTNTYIVDVAEICKLLASWDAQLDPEFKNMTPSQQNAFIRKRKRQRATGGYRKVVIRALYRLHFTTHLIQLDNSEKANEIRQMLGLLPGINRYSKRFLTACDAHDQLNDETTRYEAKWFRISLDEMTYLSLLEPFKSSDSLAVLGHKELLVSANGILILLYNLLNAHIGRSFKQHDRDAEYSIDQLHRYLAPNSKLPDFEDYFNSSIRALYRNTSTAASPKWQVNGVNRINALGFHMKFFTIDNKIESSLFMRDKADFLSGNNSLHNTHRKRNIASTMGEDVSDIFPDDDSRQRSLFSDATSRNK